MTNVTRHQARHKQLDKNTNMSGMKFSNVSHSLWGGIIDSELYLGNGTMPHSTGPLNGFYCMIYQSSPHKLISITQSVSANRKLIRRGKILEIRPVKSVQSDIQWSGLLWCSCVTEYIGIPWRKRWGAPAVRSVEVLWLLLGKRAQPSTFPIYTPLFSKKKWYGNW